MRCVICARFAQWSRYWESIKPDKCLTSAELSSSRKLMEAFYARLSSHSVRLRCKPSFLRMDANGQEFSNRDL
jgi:hypothetical protein